MKRYITTVLAFLIVVAAVAQESPKIKKSEFLITPSSEAWKSVKKGNKYYKKARKKDKVGAYRLAALYYSNALDANDSYAPLLYRLGVSEVKISDDRHAMRHLDDAASLSMNIAEDCQYWLGVSKQHLNMFQQAKNDFDECQAAFGKKTKKRLANAVDLRITQCDNGIMLSKTPEMAVMQPVKGNVNSNMPEIAPVFGNLDSSLYFGGRRGDGNVSKKRGKDYDPASDIFIAKGSGGGFGDAANAGKRLNGKKSDYPAFMNLTGGKMFYVKKDKKILFSCKKTINSHWLKPSKQMKKASSISFSKDSSMVVFTVWNGKNTRHDIFFCKRAGKKYGKAQNLSDLVNTQYDEEWAAFGVGDTVIYFASNGQNSVGGYDIMKTSYRNGKWNKPVNLGLGINSGTDENYFQLSPGETRIGYCSSKREGGKGDYDIYKVLLLLRPQVMLPPLPYRIFAAEYDKQPMLEIEKPEVIKTMRLTVVKGTVRDYDRTKLLTSKVSINDNLTDEAIQIVNTNEEDGSFVVMIPSGRNYAMTVTSDGYMMHTENFDIPSTTGYQEVEKEIRLLPMDPGSKIVLNNVFFDSDRSELRPESYGELNRLAEVFSLYPNLVIEVSGHTDNQGARMHNVQLSDRRANAVRDYLISIGVGEQQVVAKGYGPDQPRDTNATAEGRQNNRRVEAKILRN